MKLAPLEWTESAGGPLVMLPRSRVSSWEGVEGGDYGDACRIEDYAGVIARTWGDVLVLNDEPFPTACVARKDGLAIVRWMYAPTEDALLTVAIEFRPTEHQPRERLKVKLVDEPYIIFDSGRHGRDSNGVEARLQPGIQEMVTYVVRDEAAQVGLLLHRFERSWS